MKKRYVCAICGRRLNAEQAVYSRFTGNRYCRPDVGHLQRRHTPKEVEA
jgi:DNA-directed RNA polymerase subunit RPC12/RpoP